MTLDEYLFENDITVKEFAALIGYWPQYVSQCKNGTRKPSKRMIYAIEKATDGRVKI